MKIKMVLWYGVLVLTVIILFLAFKNKDIVFTLCAVGLAYFLKKTNQYIPIPRIYRDMGITNELFEGGRHEKNNQ